MKKKVISMMLTIAMTASLLAGCGSTAETESETTAETAETTESASTDTTQETGNEVFDAAEETASETEEGEPVYGGTLRYASHNTVSTPGYTPECTNNASLIYLNTAYESLIYYNETGDIIPRLATEWETDSE
ncbi:MAG TPA: hypothetical protein PLU43_09985, partial [Lachnospiraceae bacterium]|nr:hypothetical protein [Lachnospiraceae bacterium]